MITRNGELKDGEELLLYASHTQFYVLDSEPRSSPGDESFWTKESSDNRIAIGDGILGIGTGSYDFVMVYVEEHQCEPPLKLEEWDHVTECGLEIVSGFLLVEGCLSDSGVFFRIKPGKYRVRVCHANLAESEHEVENTSESWKPGDWYLVQFWPSDDSVLKVLKRRPEKVWRKIPSA